MTPSPDRYLGCLLGLALGDALGARHEGGPLERALWWVIGRTPEGTRRWTDDTQMALDLAESLLDHGAIDQDALARRFAASYTWSRGYGPGTARILRRVRRGQPWSRAARDAFPGGSFGNGAAMRSPVLALAYPGDLGALVAAVRASSMVTHQHPQAIAGASLVAVATEMLLTGATAREVIDAAKAPDDGAGGLCERLATARSWLLDDAEPAPREVARQLGNGTTAATSCATALYLALRHLDRSFEQLTGFIAAGRGDTDTIGAMAGAMWGAANGSACLPPVPLEGRELLASVALRLHAFAVADS